MNNLYNEVIMDHYMMKTNKKVLDNFSASLKGDNPSCGDEITLQVLLDGEVIVDAAFTGVGCAISQASTSIMIDLVKGKTKSEVLNIISVFYKMLSGSELSESESDLLMDAVAFENIKNLPGRVKCANLSWRTLENILNGEVR